MSAKRHLTSNCGARGPVSICRQIMPFSSRLSSACPPWLVA
jgi:hypothetical protein